LNEFHLDLSAEKRQFSYFIAFVGKSERLGSLPVIDITLRCRKIATSSPQIFSCINSAVHSKCRKETYEFLARDAMPAGAVYMQSPCVCPSVYLSGTVAKHLGAYWGAK